MITSRTRTVLFVSSLVLFLLCSLAAADENRRVLHGDRITLSVPATLSEAAAQALLEDRELALEYAESFLGCGPADTPLDVEVSFSLFRGDCYAGYLRNLVVFNRAVSERDVFESELPISHTHLGCHEETHIIAGLCWGDGSHAMTEGLATYLDAAYRGGAIYYEVALGLLETGDLQSLEDLLQAQLTSRSSINDSLMIYKGGASFVAFVLDVYGLDALREFYWRSCLPTAYLEDYAQRIFGRSLDELDTEWKEYLERKAEATRYGAALFLEAWDRQYAPLGDLRAQLGDLASQPEPAVIGRSEVCESVNTRLYALAEEILFAKTDQEADAAVERHQAELEDSERLLTEWLAAAEAFRKALQSDGEASEIAELLDRAEAGYLAVGDYNMLEAVRTERESRL